MKSTTIGHVKDRKAYVYYESLLVSNYVEKKKVKRRNNVFLKGVITRSGKALLRLLCTKKCNNAF